MLAVKCRFCIAGKLALLGLVAVLLAGCGGSGGPAATTTTAVTTQTTTGGRQITLTVFRMTNGVLRGQSVQVPETRAVAAAALHALGVDAGVSIADGTATVDLASADRART